TGRRIRRRSWRSIPRGRGVRRRPIGSSRRTAFAGVNPSSTEGVARRALLIVNPAARVAVRGQYHATRAFAHQNVHCDVLSTSGPGHATDLAREHASRYDFVFTLGGDGTAMEVITALADRGPPIGILPGGTGNVLVRALGIPLHVANAVHALLDGQE